MDAASDPRCPVDSPSHISRKGTSGPSRRILSERSACCASKSKTGTRRTLPAQERRTASSEASTRGRAHNHKDYAGNEGGHCDERGPNHKARVGPLERWGDTLREFALLISISRRARCKYTRATLTEYQAAQSRTSADLRGARLVHQSQSLEIGAVAMGATQLHSARREGDAHPLTGISSAGSVCPMAAVVRRPLKWRINASGEFSAPIRWED